METVKIEGSASEKKKMIIKTCAIISFVLVLIFLAFCVDYSSKYDEDIFENPYLYISFGFLIFGIIFSIVYWKMHKMQIIIIDKRVTGKTSFGRSVDLPIDSISSVFMGRCKGIAVATSSGIIKFLFIENVGKIYEELCALLIQRQEK